MKKIIISLISLFISQLAFAGQLALVDMDKVYNSYWKQQEELKVLQSSDQNLKNFINYTQQSAQPILQEKNEKQAALNNPSISEEERTAITARIDEIMTEVQRMQSDVSVAQLQHQNRVKNFQEMINADIQAVIAAIAEEKNIEQVFSKQALVYSQNDLTETVIERLNASKPQQ